MPIGEYNPDDDLFEATREDGKRRIRITRPDRVVVVLGRGSKPENELDAAACERDGVEMVRRRGGGCAVVLDPGNLVVSVTEHAPGFANNLAHFERLSAWLIESLEKAGVRGLTQAGISDLAIGDRKVAGACLHRSRDTLYYSASILVDADLSLMERYLKHPPREPDYRRGRTHATFLANLCPDPWKSDAGALGEALEATLA